MATGGKHTTATGEVAYIDLGVRERYQRRTSLSDWRWLRGGVMLSMVGEAGGEAAPVDEVIYNQTFKDRVSIGLTNGVGHPGQAGNRFIGVGPVSNTRTEISVLNPNNKSGWCPFGDSSSAPTYFCGIVRNGSVSTVGAGNGYVGSWPSGLTPQAESNFAWWLPFELSLSGTSVQIRTGLPTTWESNVTDQVLLARVITGASIAYTQTITGGWWNTDSGVGSGCDHLYLRVPYYRNRLRYFGSEFVQLA